MMKKSIDLIFCEWTKPDFKCMFLFSYVAMATTDTPPYLSKHDSLLTDVWQTLATQESAVFENWQMQCRYQKLCLATLYDFTKTVIVHVPYHV